jgi:hypothetical protein
MEGRGKNARSKWAEGRTEGIVIQARERARSMELVKGIDGVRVWLRMPDLEVQHREVFTP